MTSNSAATSLQSILQQTFGFPSFRANQQAVCEAAVAGRDVLLVMPTGAGKSLCYQLPALARGGTALVVSPLIALMEDQATRLTSLGMNAGRIHSGMEREASREVCRQYLDGKLDFLFIAPERLRVPGFASMLAKRKLSLIAVDEAHCISQWGHDFRPDYRNLARHIAALRPAPVMALTATATPQVQRDIVAELALEQPARFIHGFRRTNLAVEVVDTPKAMRAELARHILEDPARRPAILYAPSRKEAESLALELNRHFPTEAYHAGLAPAVRESTQRNFLAGKTEVVVATIAFGMGIDKADVRTVLHTALPATVESYYQEIGRAGRDGAPSRAILLYSFQDRRIQEFFLERDYPAADVLTRIARALGPEPVYGDDLRVRLKLEAEVFAGAVDKLLAQGVADLDFAGNLTATGRPTESWLRPYQEQLRFRRAQSEAMFQFASTAACRMAGLVRHFGDTADSARMCGLCDFCSPERTAAQTNREATADEQKEMQRILRALDGSPAKSTGKLYTDLCPRGKPERKEFDSLLEALARAGYLTLENATFTPSDDPDREIRFRRAAITDAGREAAEGEPLDGVMLADFAAGNTGAVAPATRSRGAKQKPATDEAPMNALQETQQKALREWRKQTAASLQQPAFCVFPDRTLRAIVLEGPATADDLERVAGMGPAKSARWGEAICGVLRQAATLD